MARRSLAERIARQGVRMAGTGQTLRGPQSQLEARTAPGRAGVVSDTTNALAALLKPPARKYRNVPTVANGITFDSKREAERYGELTIEAQRGEIRDLDVHPRFPLIVHGQDCGVYEADFAYVTAEGQPVVEDVKSAATRKLPTYRLKAKLLWALYGLRVKEV